LPSGRPGPHAHRRPLLDALGLFETIYKEATGAGIKEAVSNVQG